MNLGVLLFEGFELLDVFGPLEMLGQLDDLSIEMVSESIGSVKSAQGPAAFAEKQLNSSTNYQIILVPGGVGTRREVNNPATIRWISENAAKATYVASVCTGSALLAKAGVLNEKKATTNKLAYSWVLSQGPQTEWIAKARWIQDGNIFTSAGVSAGIDMSLALIKEIWGERKAQEIADWAEYHWNQDFTNDVFSEKQGLV